MIYARCTRSPLLSLTFADQLSDTFEAFTTPNQADEAVKMVNEALHASLSACQASGELPRKRRKLSPGDDRALPCLNVGNGEDSDAVKFALIARVGATALGAIFHGSKDATERTTACLESIDRLVSGALEAAFEPRTGQNGRVIKTGKGKRSRHEDKKSRWPHHCLCAALLRLWYDLFARSGAPWLETDGDRNWAFCQVFDRLQDVFSSSMIEADVFPELQLEIVSPFANRAEIY